MKIEVAGPKNSLNFIRISPYNSLYLILNKLVTPKYTADFGFYGLHIVEREKKKKQKRRKFKD